MATFSVAPDVTEAFRSSAKAMFGTDPGRTGRGRAWGRDGVARFSQSWSSRDITGWIDVGKKLLSLNAPLPSWLGGWWKVKKEPIQDYFYFFEVGGSAYRTQDEPASGVMPPPVVQPQGAFSIVRGFQTGRDPLAIHRSR